MKKNWICVLACAVLLAVAGMAVAFAQSAPTALQTVEAMPEAAQGAGVAETVEASSGWLEQLTGVVNKVDDWVWGLPLMGFVLVTGLLLTAVLRLVHVFNLKNAFRYMFHQEEADTVSGEVSSFGALCTALSATIGTGNIVGVATAVGTGGPGALFWMEVAASLNCANSCPMNMSFLPG